MKKPPLYIPILIAGVMLAGSIIACEVPDTFSRIDPDEAEAAAEEFLYQQELADATIRFSPEHFCPGDVILVEWNADVRQFDTCGEEEEGASCFRATVLLREYINEELYVQDPSPEALNGSTTIQILGDANSLYRAYVRGIYRLETSTWVTQEGPIGLVEGFRGEVKEVSATTGHLRDFLGDDYEVNYQLACNPETGELYYAGDNIDTSNYSACMTVGSVDGPDTVSLQVGEDGEPAPIGSEFNYNDDPTIPLDLVWGYDPEDIVITGESNGGGPGAPSIADLEADGVYCPPGSSTPAGGSGGPAQEFGFTVTFNLRCAPLEDMRTEEQQQACMDAQVPLPDTVIYASIPPDAGGGGAPGDNIDDKAEEEDKPGDGPFCGSVCSSDADCAGLGVNPVCTEGGLCYDAKACDTGSSGSGISGGNSGDSSGGSEGGTSQCGNGVVESGEACDGFGNGSCNWDTNYCTVECNCAVLP